eukprot:2865194-Pyramimonas_sp.AAC.1
MGSAQQQARPRQRRSRKTSRPRRARACTSQRHAPIAISAAWVMQTKLRVDRWDVCKSMECVNLLMENAFHHIDCTAYTAQH